MKRYAIVFACAFTCALGACSDVVSPRGTPADLNGMWNQDFGASFVPGSSFSIGLRDSADVVTGQGSYAGEAGPYGWLDISGTAHTDSVHLRIVYTPNAVFPQLKPDTAQFDGVLTTRDHIDGTLIRGGVPQSFSLVRMLADPV